MSETQTVDGTNRDEQLLDQLTDFYKQYCWEDIGKLLEAYPKDTRSLAVDFMDVVRYNPDIADDIVGDGSRESSPKSEEMVQYFEEALRMVDIPIDMDLSGAHVRIHGLNETHTFYPNAFSPTEEAGYYRTIKGDVLVSTDTYSKITKAAFECQRCGTLSRIVQESGDWQEPHECTGCERQGPFQVNYEQSEFVDGETFQLQTPPEKAAGMGRTLQVFVEDDITGHVEMGDRVSVSGILRLNQKESGGQKKIEFEPYLEGKHIEIEDGNSQEIDIDSETRTHIEELANGEHGDPLELAADSFAPEVYGYDAAKKALLLAIIGGATNTPDIRGNFHVLLIGDPSTSKSILTNRVKDIALRSLGVSGQQSTSAGLTSTATQGEFSDGRWTLSPGAFVKANEGVVVIDELDDMQPDDRKSMLEPMANQEINVTKAGINATLSTKTTVTAAANPKHGRFDQYEPLPDQFVFDSNLLSRFDLVFTFSDEPDQEADGEIAEHMTQYRDAKIRQERGDDLDGDKQDVVDKPVSDDVLEMWCALAKRQPDPVYENDAVRQDLRDSFVTLRGANGYSADSEVPVTFRKLPGVERVARAYAKLEFSDVITARHVETAMNLVGKSMQDYQTNEDGELDADISETGESKSQKERKQDIAQLIEELCLERDDGFAPIEKIVERSEYDRSSINYDIEKFKERGVVYEPKTDYLKWVGGA